MLSFKTRLRKRSIPRSGKQTRKTKPRYIRITTHPLTSQNNFQSTGFQAPALPELVTALPLGVASVEERDRALNMQSRIERQNAGILSAKERLLKTIAKRNKKRKILDQYQRSQQYKSEQEWQDGIPPEEEEGELLRELGFMTKPTVKNNSRNEQLKALLEDSLSGNGQPVIGWRAPRLYTLLQPMVRKYDPAAPVSQVETQQEGHQQRRNVYKQQQTDMTGVTPSSAEIKDALPETAEPLPMKAPPPFHGYLRPYVINPRYHHLFLQKHFQVHSI